MRLRKKCKFSLDNVADIASLYDDVMTLLNKSHTNDESSDKFISEVNVYVSDRPNIHREMQPNITLEEFVLQFCQMHLKAVNMHNVLTGKEKRSKVIDSVKDELEGFKKHIDRDDDDYERHVCIQSKQTGCQIYDTLDKQKEQTDVSLSNFIDSDTAMA